ncbi:MAG: hypothetical protein K9G11_04360 [Rickettsiaceae bacterium]|nr:hypothetical protein [Rickettsiaceae bacterium]
MNQQLVLPISELYHENDDYILTKCNAKAYTRLMEFGSQRSAALYDNAIILFGAKASGKSLILSLWAKKYSAKTLNVSDFDFLIEKNLRALVIDDIDKNQDEEKLLHIFNWCNQNDIFLCMSAVNLESLFLPDLTSRIKSIEKIVIEKADDEMLKIFMLKQFSNFSIHISDQVIKFIAEHVTRDLGYIKEFIFALNKTSLEKNKKISIELVKELIKKVS